MPRLLCTSNIKDSLVVLLVVISGLDDALVIPVEYYMRCPDVYSLFICTESTVGTAGLDGSFYPVVARGTGFEFDICHKGYVYTVLQTVQSPGVYSAVYMVQCTIKNPRIHSIRVGHSHDYGLPAVAILP